jgi:hypothetical protein
MDGRHHHGIIGVAGRVEAADKLSAGGIPVIAMSGERAASLAVDDRRRLHRVLRFVRDMGELACDLIEVGADQFAAGKVCAGPGHPAGAMRVRERDVDLGRWKAGRLADRVS